MNPRSLTFLLLALAVPRLLPAAPPPALAKHTVTGAGTFEHGREVRANVDRATFHPIDHHFALSVSGRMGWVITGQWVRQGNEIALTVANMNNNAAKGSGEVRLSGRGTLESVKLSGSTRGGAYRMRFKSGEKAPPPSPAPPNSVRLGPSSSGREPAPPVEEKPRDSFDRSKRGTGALRFSGGPLIPLTAGDVDLSPSGRVKVRVIGGGETHEFEGVWGSGGDRSKLDLTLHPSSGANGVVTGTAQMDRSGRALDRLELQGFRGDRSFQLSFRAGH